MFSQMKQFRTRFRSLVVVASVLLPLMFSLKLTGDDSWTRFRGPNGSGIAESKEIPSSIKADNILWKANLEGTGSSSPVAWGNKVFLTSYGRSTEPDTRRDQLKLFCIELDTGRRLWVKEIPIAVTRLHGRNSFASSTPACDAKHVYLATCDRSGASLAAFDHEGNEVWKKSLGRFPSQHGFGASPIVYNDQVILFHSQQGERMRSGAQPGTSRMLCFACDNGEQQWSTRLNTTRTCYAVPAIISREDGSEEIVSCNTGNGFFGIAPDTGKLNWSTEPFKMRTVASMVWSGDRLFGSCGSGGGGNYLVALKPSETASSPFTKAYQIDKANYVPTPIVVADKLFLFTDKGIGRCFDVNSGKLIWEKRLAKGFSGSPVAANGHIYVIKESGELITLKAGKEPKVVSEFDLKDSSRATPSIVGDYLLVRSESELFCFVKK